MASDAAKQRDKDRVTSAVCVNAQARNRGLVRLNVRGLKKAKAVAMLFALAHNLMRAASLAPQLISLWTVTSGFGEMGARRHLSVTNWLNSRACLGCDRGHDFACGRCLRAATLHHAPLKWLPRRQVCADHDEEVAVDVAPMGQVGLWLSPRLYA